MGGRSTSTSKSSVETSNVDRRTAAQDSGVAISNGNGDVYLDMVPDAVLDFVQDATSGAFDLVARSAETTNDALAVAAGRDPQPPINPLAVAAVALGGAYLIAKVAK